MDEQTAFEVDLLIEQYDLLSKQIEAAERQLCDESKAFRGPDSGTGRGSTGSRMTMGTLPAEFVERVRLQVFSTAIGSGESWRLR